MSLDVFESTSGVHVQGSPILQSSELWPRLHRFTVDQYHQMADAGVFAGDQRAELLNGWIFNMTPIGPDHSATVEVLREILQQVVPDGFCLRFQQPVTLLDSEPQPDAAIARGKNRDYRQRHPSPAELAVVIEVAGSSLSLDQGLKTSVYAAAGVPEYWVVNLVERRIEVYRQPQPEMSGYSQSEYYGRGQSVRVVLGGQECVVPVAELFE